MKAEPRTTLIIGGCRSGKSSHALGLAQALTGGERIFIATCVPRDEEMRDRVRRHRMERHDSWKTFEIPVDIAASIQKHSPVGEVILVDCLTLWISNILLETEEMDVIQAHVDQLAETITKVRCPIFLVSNEVGLGIVPDNPLARLFRDAAGFANQRIAAACDRVVWMVAGIPVTIKER
jgi:adenosylcobinamide kinase/adenosylcobinamide-phosphate guanylyltransferase